ncbi:MAG: hypothetical protein HYR80_02130 [Nitrospirae bacterium]|nr:hypothetical protein [Nitrospirota bacterium]
MEIYGKSLDAITKDIEEAYFVLNPLTIKKLEPEHYKPFHQALLKEMISVRAEGFPAHDLDGIRRRNIRMQRLRQALAILENIAKEKRIKLV